MKKFKKIIISLLISGALALCFTACGGGGGGGGDSSGNDSTISGNGQPVSPSSTALPSSLVGRTMTTFDGVWMFTFKTQSNVSAQMSGNGGFGAATLRGNGTYSYNASTKSLSIYNLRMGANGEYRYSFAGTLSNVRKAASAYNATYSYTQTSSLPGGTTLSKEEVKTVGF